MEQRLIDGNELFGIVSLLNSDIVKANPVARWLIQQVLHDIGAMPTINPEDLQIVKQLREELEKVTAERDSLKSDIETVMHIYGIYDIFSFLCSICEKNKNGKCAVKECDPAYCLPEKRKRRAN